MKNRNLIVSDIFSKDIETEAGKIIKMRQIGGGGAADPAETMVISIENKYPSAVYNRFLIVQHLSSTRPELLTAEAIDTLLEELTECYAHSTFTNSVVRHATVTIHQLVILLIAKREDIVQRALLDKVVRFFATVKKNGEFGVFSELHDKLHATHRVSISEIEMLFDSIAFNCPLFLHQILRP